MPVLHPLVHLVCGSTGAGKTTYAIALTDRIGGIRFSIDDWMTRLFWMDSPTPIDPVWVMERIRRCYDQIWAVAAETAKRGTPVVLDLGFTRVEERARFADLAQAARLAVRLHFIDVGAAERWRRVQTRNAEKGATYRLEVTRDMFDFVEAQWEAPDSVELMKLDGVRI